MKRVVALAAALAAVVAVARPASADPGGICQFAPFQTPIFGLAAPLCTAGGALYIHNDGSISGGGGSTTFPYSGTANGQTATTASFLGSGALYNATPPTLTSGQFSPFQVDVNGNQKVAVVNTVPTTDTNGGTQGTGATYNPPTGGSGFLGFLSGIFADLNRQTFTTNALNVHNDGSFTSGGGTTPSTILGYVTTGGQNALCATACTVTGYQQLGTAAEPANVTGNFFDSTSATPTGSGVGFIGPLGVGQSYTFPGTFKSTTALEVIMANAPTAPIVVYGHTP